MNLLSRTFIAALLIVLNLYSRGEREFTATEGYTLAKDLQSDFKAQVDSISYRRYDAFEGSRTHSKMEEEIFEIGNMLHIVSKEKTIRRRLLFIKGDIVTRELLLETERRLRREQFLADAVIEIKQSQGGGVIVLVHTYDQFSTIPAWGLQKPGDKWTYWFGPVESNLIGTGQKISLFYSHGVDRDSYMGMYENKAFIFNNLQLTLMGSNTTDGYSYQYLLKRPLFSKTDRWGYEVSGYGMKYSKYVYLDANIPGEAQRRAEASDESPATFSFFKAPSIGSELLFKYEDVVDLSFSTNITRSFGKKNKFLVRPTFTWKERYQDGNPNDLTIEGGILQAFAYSQDINRSEYLLDFRNDYLAGLYLSYYQNEYKTVKNFRNLKWSENLDVGFRISNGIYQNLKFMGANNADLFLKHTLVYINVWQSKHFLSTSLNTSYFLGYEGDLDDGTVSHNLEYQWKPIPATATYMASHWKHYFAREKSAQLVLGGEEGLNAYPNRFFSGQAQLLMEIEQRYFPDIEFGTAVPALAVFLNAGNTFEAYDKFEWSNLHYGAGFGIRIGATRSVQKVVNHLNLSFPLDSKYRRILDTWKFTLVAKATL
jgi:hypothetical protein